MQQAFCRRTRRVAGGRELARIRSSAAKPDRAATGRPATLYRLRIDVLPGTEGREATRPSAQRTAGPRSQQTPFGLRRRAEDRKSTRLNSSHITISYAVFCLKKKNK